MRITAFQWTALNFFGYFCAFGVFVPFFPLWLKSQSYGEELIGLVIASAYIFRFAGGMFFSARIKQVTQLVSGLRYMAWASLVIVIAMNFASAHFIWLFFIIALFAFVNAGGMPLSDTLTSIWQQQIHLDYGQARLIGSLAFVVGVVVFGYLIGMLGETWIIWILAGLFLFYGLCLIPRPHPMPRNTQSAVEISPSFMQLLRNPVSFRLLLAISLIQGSHAAYYSYSVLHWTAQGISVQVTSLLWGLAVVAEILLFFFSNRLFRHWKVSSLFYLSTLGAVVRWVVLSEITDVALIALSQCLHSLTFATSHYAIVRYFSTQPQHHIAKLQGLYSGVSSCAFIALLTAFSGMLYPISPSLTFLSMAGIAGLALLITPRKVDAFLLRRH